MPRAPFPRPVLVALFLALCPLLGRAADERPRPAAIAIQALNALNDDDVARARALLAPLEPFAQGDAPVQLAGGVLRFHEQRYAEAVALIEASGAGAASGYLPLAKGALEVTRDHARFEGEHFVVSYPKGKDEVLVPYLIDALEKQRAALAAALGPVPDGKVAVELVSDVKQLATVSTLTEAEVRTSGTVAVSKFSKLMMLSPKALLKGYDWLDTACHEYVHYVVTARTHNRAPLWLQEGLAKWLEAAWRDRREALTPFSAALVRDAIARKQLVTFDEMNPSFAKLPTQERAALAYAQVVLAVEYMVKQRGPTALGQLTGFLAEGRSSEDAVAATMGLPFRRFLSDWNKYMAGRPLPRGGDHELTKLRFKDDPGQSGAFAEWAELPDEDSKGFARLGEIFRARGRWAAARVEYGKAYAKVGARIPILSGQYALAATMSGRKAEAEKVLTEALAWDPDYPALNLQLARLLVDRGQSKEARDHLLAANRQDPFDPEIHAGLAKVLETLGDPGGSSREARFARILTGKEGPSR
jgi:tetratricopeptide (TPR) repeat protein